MRRLKWMWIAAMFAGGLSPSRAAEPAKATPKPTGPRMDGEVDYQGDEDDEALGLPAVQLKAVRFHGQKIANLRCDGITKNKALEDLLAKAWTHSRNVEDPKVLQDSVDSARKALKLDPKCGRGMVILASSLAKLGKTQEAGRLYESFVLSCPTHVDASRIAQTLERYELAKKAKASGSL